MKKSVDVVGLPVISIGEGKELGNVKSLLINHTAGTVAGLVIDDGKWYLGAKILPFGDVAGIGEYAVTVENSTRLASVTTTPEFESLLAADVQVIGSKVLTKGGRIQGKVTEILFDETGKITNCEIEETGGNITHIPSQRIITFGKEILFITDVEEPSVKAATAPKSQVENISAVQSAVVGTLAPTVPAQEDDSAKKFDEKHRKYLLGKKASRRIETDNGVVIVEQGGEITEEVIQKAKLAGKFVELSMNIQ